jgi:adenylate kinase family enzyme
MLMGPPGSGKGTQAAAARKQFGFVRIETSAMLRGIRDEPSTIGKRVRALIDAGEFKNTLMEITAAGVREVPLDELPDKLA